MLSPSIVGRTTKSKVLEGSSAEEWIKVSSRSRKMVILSGVTGGGSPKKRGLAILVCWGVSGRRNSAVSTAAVFLSFLKPCFLGLRFGVAILASLENILTRRRRQLKNDSLMVAITTEEGEFLTGVLFRRAFLRQSLMDFVGVRRKVLDTIF